MKSSDEIKQCLVVYVACVLQCVAVYCNVLQCVAMRYKSSDEVNRCVAVYVVACCSVLQLVAVCCSVLQCAMKSSDKVKSEWIWHGTDIFGNPIAVHSNVCMCVCVYIFLCV